MKRFLFLLCLVILVLVLASCSITNNHSGDFHRYNKVRLVADEHFQVVGQKEVYVEKGETAIFNVIAEEGYELQELSCGFYNPEEGKLYISNVVENMVVTMTSRGKICNVSFLGEHFRVLEGSDLWCAYGETLEVTLLLSEGYEVLSVSGGVYNRESNTIRIENVKQDTKVEILTAYVTAPPIPPVADEHYTVTFVGVTGIPSQTVVAGAKVTKPQDPQKENYNFDGWYKDSMKFNFNQVIEGNIVLEARFSPKWFEIVYDLGGVNAENTNPYEYVYSEENDLYFAPLYDPDQEYFFLGWSMSYIPAGTAGEIEVKANWIEMEKLIRNYGFEANDGSFTRIHYAEKQGNYDDENTWYVAPDGVPQYYESVSGTGSAGFYIMEEWCSRLNFNIGVWCVFSGWKSINAMPIIQYGLGENGQIVNPYYSTTVGNKVVTGFESYTTNNGVPEKYDVAALFPFSSGLSENVIINVDFRMRGEGAFPLNFYLYSNSYYNNKYFNMFSVDGNGDIVVGEDTRYADRVAYVDGSGNPIAKKVIGNVGDEKWHTFTIEMRQATGGYMVTIKVDGMQCGDALMMLTDFSFTGGGDNFSEFRVFGGGIEANQIVDDIVATGKDVEVTYDLDNFVVYAR